VFGPSYKKTRLKKSNFNTSNRGPLSSVSKKHGYARYGYEEIGGQRIPNLQKIFFSEIFNIIFAIFWNRIRLRFIPYFSKHCFESGKNPQIFIEYIEDIFKLGDIETA